MKKGLANICFIVMCMLMLTLFVACNNGSTPPHEHTYNEDAWVTDGDHHWYAATCEHTEEVKAKAPHTWDEGKETTPPKPGVAGVKTFTCTICNATRTEPIPALPPQSGDIGFATGYQPGKTYDRDPISINKSQIVRIVDGVQTPITNPDDISFMFKPSGADDSDYSDVAPTNPGSYTVKIIVEASTGWERKEHEAPFFIDKIKLTGEYDIKKTLEYKGENHLISEWELTHADLPCILEGDTVVIKDIKTNKNAGTNPVDDYTIVANDYYDDKSPLNISATVNPFNISPDTPINVTKVYDGTTNAEYKDWGYTIPEADRGKLLILTVTADGKDVGNHNPGGFNPIAFTLDGASTSNYTIDKSKISINITARPLSFNENPTAVYDGSNRKVVAEPEIINNIVDGESLTITIETGNQNVLSPDATPPTGLTYTISAGTNTISSNYQIKQSEIDRARIIPVELVLKDPNSDALTKFEYQNNKKLTKKVDVLFNGIVNGQDITLEVEFSDVDVHSSYKDHKFLIGYGSTTYNYKLSETDYQQLKTAKISPKTLRFYGNYYMATKGNSLLYFMLPSQIQSIGLIKVRLNVSGEHANWEVGQYYNVATCGWTLTPEPTNQNFTVKIIDNATIYVRPLQSPSPTVTVGGTGTEVTTDAHGRLYCKIEGAVKGEKYTIIVKDGTETVSYDKMTLRADGTFIVQYIAPDTGIFEFNGDNDKVLQLHAELTENQTYTVKVAKVTKVT